MVFHGAHTLLDKQQCIKRLHGVVSINYHNRSTPIVPDCKRFTFGSSLHCSTIHPPSASFLFSAGMRFQSTNTSAYGLKGWIGWHRKVRASLHDKLFNISCQELHVLTISKLSRQRATINQDAFNTNFPGWSCEEFEQMYYHVEWNAKKKKQKGMPLSFDYLQDVWSWHTRC